MKQEVKSTTLCKKSVHHGEDRQARRGAAAATGLALAHTFYSLNAASNGAEIW